MKPHIALHYVTVSFGRREHLMWYADVLVYGWKPGVTNRWLRSKDAIRQALAIASILTGNN